MKFNLISLLFISMIINQIANASTCSNLPVDQNHRWIKFIEFKTFTTFQNINADLCAKVSLKEKVIKRLAYLPDIGSQKIMTIEELLKEKVLLTGEELPNIALNFIRKGNLVAIHLLSIDKNIDQSISYTYKVKFVRNLGKSNSRVDARSLLVKTVLKSNLETTSSTTVVNKENIFFTKFSLHIGILPVQVNEIKLYDANKLIKTISPMRMIQEDPFMFKIKKRNLF